MSKATLPPSMEKAYQSKCVELRRRLSEIEDANDTARLRKRRLGRSIMKMRLERAFLLDKLGRLQQMNSADDSDRSPSPPSMLHDRSRPRRNPAPRSPPLPEQMASFSANVPSLNDANVSIPTHGGQRRAQNLLESPTTVPSQARRSVSRREVLDKRALSEVPPHEALPFIYELPNGTEVVLLENGLPKRAPWTVADIQPRHHLKAGFDNMSKREQDALMQGDGYRPFDLKGRPVNLVLNTMTGRWKQIFKGEAEWVDPEQVQMRKEDARMHSTNGTSLRNGALSRQDMTMPPHSQAHDGEMIDASTEATGGFTAMNSR